MTAFTAKIWLNSSSTLTLFSSSYSGSYGSSYSYSTSYTYNNSSEQALVAAGIGVVVFFMILAFALPAAYIYFWIVVNGLRRQIVKWSLEKQGQVIGLPGFQHVATIPVTPTHQIRPQTNFLEPPPPPMVAQEKPPVEYSEVTERY